MANDLKLEQIWINPPLAFARFGRSETPLENFSWAQNDYAARGTAETILQPEITFKVQDDGSLKGYLPDGGIVFKEKNGDWRPVCPFFELHGRFSDGKEGPVDFDTLKAAGINLRDLSWEVHAANLKAHHYTFEESDKVEARVSIPGNDHVSKDLAGKSPLMVKEPIVPVGENIHYGKVQVIRPTDDYPHVRIRITPPGGFIYCPKNTPTRDLSALLPPNENNAKGKAAFLSQLKPILNGKSHWAKWKPVDGDMRTSPGGLYAQTPDMVSLGFLDDSCDALITVSVNGRDDLKAYARYSCCPPDFQPDRRPFTSLADALTDQERREEVLDPAYVSGENWPITEAEIADLMQRVRETMEASNLDHQNLRSFLANSNRDYPFEPEQPRPGHPLPLTESGRAHHARFLAYEVFKGFLAKNPGAFDRIRNPEDEPLSYDQKMPALMRGSDSNPMYISMRQYYELQNWLAEVVKQSGEEA